jgi:hypothetical protein
MQAFLDQKAIDAVEFGQAATRGRALLQRASERKAFALEQRGGKVVTPSPYIGMERQIGGVGQAYTPIPTQQKPMRFTTPASRKDYTYNAPDLNDPTSPARRGRFGRQ